MNIWKAFTCCFLAAVIYQTFWGLGFSYGFPALELPSNLYPDMVFIKLISELILYGLLALLFVRLDTGASVISRVVCCGVFTLLFIFTAWALVS